MITAIILKPKQNVITPTDPKLLKIAPPSIVPRIEPVDISAEVNPISLPRFPSFVTSVIKAKEADPNPDALNRNTRIMSIITK